MKTKMIAPMLLAALFIGTSCSKDSVVEEVEKPMEETKTVQVKFSMPDSPLTRIGDTAASDTRTSLHDAVIYFADKGDTILRKYELSPNPDIAVGIKLTGVPMTATKMYMYANKTASGMGTYPVLTADLTLDGLKKLLVDIPVKGQTTAPTLAETNKVTSADKAIMDGSAVLAVDTKAVTVALSPIVARMEIDKITVDASISPTGLLITGIFINNFYNKFNASGVGSDFQTIKTATLFTTNYPSGTAGAGYLNNYYKQGDYGLNAQNSPSAIPATRAAGSETWAYQVFPATNGDDVTLDSLPHIVIKLEKVAVAGQPTKAVQFVTVKKYKDAGGASVTSFVRGNVYKIANIVIASKDLSDEPEGENKEVTATITVNPWTLNNIVPDL